MKVVCDIETNSLTDPDQIWVIVCRDIDSGKVSIFRHVTGRLEEKERFLAFAKEVDQWVGHNWLGYDYPVLSRLMGLVVSDIAVSSVDTYILSKLINYSRQGHSVEDYGLEFGLEKGKVPNKEFFKQYSRELEDYCIRDVDITYKIYLKYLRYLKEEHWKSSIALEHKFQLIVNDLENNGFSFNSKKAQGLLTKVTEELGVLDQSILKEFPPREVLIREFTPKATKFGTISKSSVPRSLQNNIHEYEVGKTYKHTKLEPFNPSSHKQLIGVLTEAGWSPTDRTQSHIDALREINRLKYRNKAEVGVDLGKLSARLEILKKSGWKINEQNLSTLPDSAPAPARLLAKRILLESRRRTLTEWLGLVRPDGRIHGKFYALGAWTHRMAHQSPNTANIPNEFKVSDGSVTLLGKEMRSLWQAPRNRLLVGVDAETIQLRIFAHYVDDPDFTKALVEGKKEDKTDAHSLNKEIMGAACKTRQAAKHGMYAYLLGGGWGKIAQIMKCSKEEAEEAFGRLLERYKGFAYLKKEVIPLDAKRGWFEGLDGRHVPIPGTIVSERKHLAMSGYLQNGEIVCMKRATLLWYDMLDKEFGNEGLAIPGSDALVHSNIVLPVGYFDRNDTGTGYPSSDRKAWKLVNFVHDEWQTECKNDMEVALKIAAIQADSLRIVGEELNLKCPLAGSFWSDELKDYTINTNWSKTH